MSSSKRKASDRISGEAGAVPIGAVQLPSTGIRYDRHGNPKPLPSGQDEHTSRAANRTTQRRSNSAPELAFATDVFADDPKQRSVLNACHKALAGRQLTVAELRRKLVNAKFDQDAIDFGVERCCAAGLLDDQRYVQEFVSSRIRRGHGALRIRQDLKRRGLDSDLVEAELSNQGEHGLLADAAFDTARRRCARVDISERQGEQKVIRYLQSRGFTMSQACDAIAKVRQERAELES